MTYILLLFGTSVYSQDYKISYSTQAYNIWSNYSTESVDFEMVTNFETKEINGDGVLIIRGKPNTINVISYLLDIDEFGDIIYECQPPAQTIELSYTDCFNYANSSFLTICTGAVFVNVEITPILTFNSNTTSENNASNSIPYCISEPIRLVAQSGFSSYKWEYRVLGESWKSFNPGSGSDVTFTLNNVLGSQAGLYLNKTIFFRYNVGNCSSSKVSPSKQYVFTIPPPRVDILSLQNPTCFNGGNGSISVVALDRALLSGENITYSLKDNNGALLDQKVSGNFSGLNSGAYTISIQPISSAYCSTPPALKEAILINPSKIAITVANIVPSTCYGSSTGAITINPSGGSGTGFSYSIDGGSFSSSSTFSNLSAGSHNVSVKDSKGCVDSKSIIVSGPTSGLNSFIAITSNYSGESLSCNSSSDASVLISANGGWGGYSYSTSQTGTYTTTSSFNNLGEGLNTFWIKDSKGCIISQEVLISPPQKLVVNGVSITQPSCSGDFGSIAVNTSGGTGTILYSIDNLNFQSLSEFNLVDGNYQVYTKDLNGCTAISPMFSIINPLEITYFINKTDISCREIKDGSISFQNIRNGNAPYQYSIDGGANYSTSPTFSSLSSGNYNVSVKDTKGCIASTLVFVSEPVSVTGSILASNVSCNGDSNGTLIATGTGGAGGYNYLWSNGSSGSSISSLNSGNYSVIITDQMGCASQPIIYNLVEPTPILITPMAVNVNGYNISCNGTEDGQIDLIISGGTIVNDYQYTWSNGYAGNSLIGVGAGEYQIVITDDNSCSASELVVVTEAEILSIVSNVTDVSCYGGSDGAINISAVGGVGGYLYSINGYDKGYSSFFTGLTSGEYSIEVEDLNGCQIESIITISEPVKIILQEVAVVSTLCGQANGSVDIAVNGGIMPYVFEWMNVSSELISSDEDLTAVDGGTYSLLVTDDNGCTESITSSVSNSNGPIIQTQMIEGTSCFDSEDGNAKISVTGGIPPYEINWSNGEVGIEAIGLFRGEVEISVKDQSACVSYLKLSIPGSNQIEIDEIIINRPSCFNENDGSVEIIASGGVSPLDYLWSNGETGEINSMLSAGELDLTIVDANGCSIVEAITIDQPTMLEMSLDIVPPTCGQEDDGRAVLSISGGVGPYQVYLDGEMQSTNVLDQLNSGNYSIEIADSNLCSLKTTFTIPEPEPWTFAYDDLVICEGQEVSLESPEIAINTRWYLNNEFISVNNELVISSAGEYSIIATDSLGCLGEAKFQVITSTEVLNADFLMSSKGTTGDTIIVIDITYPIPDSINWVAPAGAEIIESTDDYAIFIISEAGIYDFGFDAYLGLCQDFFSSTIEIYDNSEIQMSGRISGDSSPRIISFEMYPNPTDGFFSAEGVTREAFHSLIRLISLSNNLVVLEETSPSKFIHTFNFELPNLAIGAYVLVFESAGETKVIRMIKQ